MKTLPFTLCTLAFVLTPGAARADEDVSEVLRTKCKSCHGSDGKAQTKVGKEQHIDDLSTPKWQTAHTDDDIRDAITNGVPKTKMKPFKEKLTPGQIDALVKWVRGLKADPAP
jgi:mono/diheme cytochrome c family protein